MAPPAWRGSLPLTYHLGPGAAKVHLLVKSDWSQKPIYDVIATLTGRDFPDEWVIRGNHHDGWVEGAWDPLAGAVAELAEARAIGGLLEERLAAAAHAGVRQLGWRGAGSARLHRVGGDPCAGAAGQGRAVSELR